MSCAGYPHYKSILVTSSVSSSLRSLSVCQYHFIFRIYLCCMFLPAFAVFTQPSPLSRSPFSFSLSPCIYLLLLSLPLFPYLLQKERMSSEWAILIGQQFRDGLEHLRQVGGVHNSQTLPSLSHSLPFSCFLLPGSSVWREWMMVQRQRCGGSMV